MRLFAFLGGLLVLALIAALVAPPYIDWNQFKARFETEASLALGLPVKVKGQASARLLPLPSVTFTELEIGDEDSEKPLLIADSFKIDVELAPLLKGDVVVVDMQLTHPILTLDLDQNGRLNLPQIDPGRQQFQNADVSLENISIANGRIEFSDQRHKRDIALENINAVASARALVGPWRISGKGVYDENNYRIALQTGSWQETEQMRVNVRVEPQTMPYDFDFAGPLVVRDNLPSWSGRLTVAPMRKPNNEDLIEFRRPKRETALPLRLESDLEIVSGGATVPAFELAIGSRDDPYTVTGSGRAVFGEDISFRIRAEGQQVNVERFASSQNTGVDFGQRISALRDFLTNIPQFEGDGEVNLYLPAVVTEDTVIREVGMDLRPAIHGAGWQVGNLEAQLPGRTDLRADGQLILGDAFGYQGQLLLASKQPSGFAKWLGSDVSPAIRDLSTAGFSAHANISEELLELDEVEILLDGESLEGNVRRQVTEGERPNLIAKLSGDAVDFDQLSSLFALFSNQDSTKLTQGHDLDLDLEANTMAISGLKARDVVARIVSKPERITIDRLAIADMAGTSLDVKGVVEDLLNRPVGKLQSRLISRDPTKFLDVFNRRFGPFPVIGDFIKDPARMTDTNLSIGFLGASDGYALKMEGQSGGSEINAEITGDDLTIGFDRQKIKGKLVVVNKEASNLLLQLGMPVVPLNDSGRAALRVAMSGTADEGLKTEAALTMRDGYLSASGSIQPKVDFEDLIVAGQLDVSGELQDLDRVTLLTGLSLPGFGDGQQSKFSAKLGIDGTQIEARQFSATLGASKIDGFLDIDLGQKPRPFASGTLSLNMLDTETLTGLVYTGIPGAPYSLDPDLGNGDDPENTIRPIFYGLDADLSLKAEKVRLSETYPMAESLAMSLQLRDGDIALQNIRTNWMTGQISGAIGIAQTSAARVMNGQLKMTSADIRQLAERVGWPKGLSGDAAIEGTFETAGSDLKSMMKELTASGSIQVKNGVVSGFNGDGFGSLLTIADGTDDEELAEEVTSILNSHIDGGRFKFKDVDLPFNVSSGLLRVNSMQIENDDVQVIGTGRYELLSAKSEFDARVTYSPGKEAVVGAVPEFDLNLEMEDGALKRQIDSSLLATYLGMRVSERRERDFESQQSEILERQRLQQMARIYSLQEDARRIAEQERERIRQFEQQQNALRLREEARRRREEIERKRVEAELLAAERRAAREAALEAGRRERRQQEIDLLRKKAQEAADRLRLDDAGVTDDEPVAQDN